MFSFSELDCNTGTFDSKRPIKKNENKNNKPTKRNGKQRNQNRKIYTKMGLKTPCEKSLGKLKKNRKNPRRCESGPIRDTLGQGRIYNSDLFTSLLSI